MKFQARTELDQWSLREPFLYEMCEVHSLSILIIYSLSRSEKLSRSNRQHTMNNILNTELRWNFETFMLLLPYGRKKLSKTQLNSKLIWLKVAKALKRSACNYRNLNRNSLLSHVCQWHTFIHSKSLLSILDNNKPWEQDGNKLCVQSRGIRI